MTEPDLRFLTKDVIPGKIFYAASFFHSLFNVPVEAIDVKVDAGLCECEFHDVGDVDYDETRYESPTDVPLESWLRDHKSRQGDEKEQHRESISDGQRTEGGPSEKAVKANDAEVLVHLWNDRIVDKLKEE